MMFRGAMTSVCARFTARLDLLCSTALRGISLLYPPGSPERICWHTLGNSIWRGRTASVIPRRSVDSPVCTYRIVSAYPHDRRAFTQGLAFENGMLYEGTGLYGLSTLRKIELETGRVLKTVKLPHRFFGEGLTLHGDEVIQITWRSKVGFIYDKESFEFLREFKYATEGWGITHDGERLIMSHGTSTLCFLHPGTFEAIGQVEVHDASGPVTGLNELEYVEGEIYANVWPTDHVARISPGTGQVVGWIDLKGLLCWRDRVRPVNVLNGIAYDKQNRRLFVTGKLWPRLFEVELRQQANAPPWALK
jgi:glutamine cyclotransferase